MKMVRFYRSVYWDNRYRKDRKRSIRTDVGLYAVNRILQPLEWILTRAYAVEDQPIVFIVGAPRSGTTLLYQLMCRYTVVAYVSNFAARFWMAPLIGSMVAAALRRSDPGGIPLTSHLGGTVGSASPHEFTYFWEFHTGSSGVHHLTRHELQSIDWTPVRRELSALSHWSRRPLVLKAINYVDYQIPFFRALFPNSRFIHVRRDPRYVAQSILESRVRRYGSDRVWWSIRPRDVDAWRDRDPVEQVCHQVRDCLSAVDQGMREVGAEASMEVDYEQLVKEPDVVLERVACLMGDVRFRDRDDLVGLDLRSANVSRLDPAVLARIDAGLEGTAG